MVARTNQQTCEADSVRHYCQHHALNRPRIKWFAIAMTIVAFEVTCGALLICLQLTAGSSMLLLDAIHLSALLLCGRIVLRTVVRIYQRYAPEAVRRQCSCQPSCSEYALLALRKYSWPRALLMTIHRLTHTCRQPGYKLDYP